MTWPVFVSYYTNDDVYRPAAQRLKKSLEKYNLPHEIVEIGRSGGVSHNQKLKPEFVSAMLEKHNSPIVWIDADNQVLEEPILLKKINSFDIMVIRFEQYDWELTSSVVAFNCREMTNKIINTWEYITKNDNNHGDQFGLHIALQHYALHGATVGMLPLEYAGKNKGTAVIYQHQASIEGRDRYGE